MKKILIVVAHPDDAEFCAGGAAIRWRERGDVVKFVSVTNGDAGHHFMERAALEARRRLEAKAVADAFGIEYQVLDHPDGELLPNLENRREMIRLIREFQPDLILTHRPCDYHPDHRYTSALVLDSSYMVTVPLICPETPHLRENPFLGYLFDHFQKPLPHSADAVLVIDDIIDSKWDMFSCHESQFFEWLAYNSGVDEVPTDLEGRRRFLIDHWSPDLLPAANAARDLLIDHLGEESGRAVVYAETFEMGEHGGTISEETQRELFPPGTLFRRRD